MQQCGSAAVLPLRLLSFARARLCAVSVCIYSAWTFRATHACTHQHRRCDSPVGKFATTATFFQRKNDARAKRTISCAFVRSSTSELINRKPTVWPRSSATHRRSRIFHDAFHVPASRLPRCSRSF